MIDEAHRTQGSDLGDNIFEAFPNAARIAFTGTPLITERHGERRTVKRFGEYIDTYKLMDAVADGTTLQILYEGRTAEAALNDKHGFETRFENLFKDRSDAELLAIKKKYGAIGDMLEAEKRIEAIARDLVALPRDNILPNGFKAQVVCHSKLAAVRYQKAIHEALRTHGRRGGRQARARCGLHRRCVPQSRGGDLRRPTNEPAATFAGPQGGPRWNAKWRILQALRVRRPDKSQLTGIAFLVVCDMLLTGFDAPIEQVMYIDKKLRSTICSRPSPGEPGCRQQA
jgi:type I restriction enzyme, R subunit